jgi:hypothetical protein
MNQDKHGPWQNWKWGSEYGAYERRISQIIQDFTGKKPVQTREKEDHGITGVSVPTDKARGYWLRDLRQSSNSTQNHEKENARVNPWFFIVPSSQFL